jgi:hypothetical protein
MRIDTVAIRFVTAGGEKGENASDAGGGSGDSGRGFFSGVVVFLKYRMI